MSRAVLQSKKFEAGAVIFAAGMRSRHAYLIRAGAVDIVIGEAGATRVLDTLGPGEVFGETALIGDQPQPATAIARLTTTCVLFDRGEFGRRLDAMDGSARAMLERVLTEPLRRVAAEYAVVNLGAAEAVGEDKASDAESGPAPVVISRAGPAGGEVRTTIRFSHADFALVRDAALFRLFKERGKGGGTVSISGVIATLIDQQREALQREADQLHN